MAYEGSVEGDERQNLSLRMSVRIRIQFSECEHVCFNWRMMVVAWTFVDISSIKMPCLQSNPARVTLVASGTVQRENDR